MVNDDNAVRLREHGWKVAAVCSVGILIPVVIISVAAKDPLSRTLIVALFAGLIGWAIAAPWLFYVYVMRKVLVKEHDGVGQVVIREGIGHLSFRTRTYPIRGGKIESVSFMAQRLSGDSGANGGVQLYLENVDLHHLQDLFRKHNSH